MLRPPSQPRAAVAGGGASPSSSLLLPSPTTAYLPSPCKWPGILDGATSILSDLLPPSPSTAGAATMQRKLRRLLYSTPQQPAVTPDQTPPAAAIRLPELPSTSTTPPAPTPAAGGSSRRRYPPPPSLSSSLCASVAAAASSSSGDPRPARTSPRRWEVAEPTGAGKGRPPALRRRSQGLASSAAGAWADLSSAVGFDPTAGGDPPMIAMQSLGKRLPPPDQPPNDCCPP